MVKKWVNKWLYLLAVGKLQEQCAKDDKPWGEFVKKLTELNGGITTNAATPPPKPPIDPLP